MTRPTIDNPTEAELRQQLANILGLETAPDGQSEFLLIRDEYDNVLEGTSYSGELDDILTLIVRAKEAWTREVQSLIVADKEVRFSHTAVNGDMHMFIDNFHNPTVCPECIQPGLLVNQERIN